MIQLCLLNKFRSLIALCVFAALPFAANAQKARDVLESGEVVEQDERVYIKYETGANNFQYNASVAYPYFRTAKDSLLLLPQRTGFQLYLFPLNPLRYADSTAQKLTADPINEEAAKALDDILQVVNKMSGASTLAKEKITTNETNSAKAQSAKFATLVKVANIKNEVAQKSGVKGKKKDKDITYSKNDSMLNKVDSVLYDIKPLVIDCFAPLKDLAERIHSLLDRDQRKEINSAFTALRNLDFEDSAVTGTVIRKVAADKAIIGLHFDTVKQKIDSFAKLVDDYDCNPERALIDNFVLVQIQEQLSEIANNQAKRLKNLSKAFGLVDSAYNKAKKNPENNFWFTRKPSVEFTDGKISTYTMAIYESGYELSDDSEIVVSLVKKKKDITITARRFQRFVPEVSAGIAYVDLRFPKYGTTTDSAGIMRVADAGEDIVRKLNFTAMINFNYYIPNSNLHPFYQIGVGINAGYPTLFTGIGTRINFAPLKRLAIAFGYASTWVKTLNTLHIGSPVSGTAELEKDITYEFNWPLKPYMSLQYNF